MPPSCLFIKLQCSVNHIQSGGWGGGGGGADAMGVMRWACCIFWY